MRIYRDGKKNISTIVKHLARTKVEDHNHHNFNTSLTLIVIVFVGRKTENRKDSHEIRAENLNFHGKCNINAFNRQII